MNKSIFRYSLYLALLWGPVYSGCGDSQKGEPTLPATKTKGDDNSLSGGEASGLQARLDNKKAGFLARAPQAKIDAYQRGVDELAASGILRQARQVGERAVDFTLPDAVGDSVSLGNFLKQGPVILTWYRGGWCPYCNLTLSALQEYLPKFKAAGATVLALTPELPDKSLDTRAKNALEFEVLSDVGNAVARQYGIVFTLPTEVSEFYRQNFSLLEYNGDASDELPLSATYVIDRDGTIRYAFLDADYRRRAEPEELLAALLHL